MSLATRCSACGTIFRVVEDQLRVSDGWVRCGRCAEVFDARAQLFDIDREAPPAWPADAAQQQVPPAAEQAAVVVAAPNYQADTEPELTPEVWVEEPVAPSQAPYSEPERGGHTPTPEHGSAPLDSRFDARLEPHWSDEPLAPTPATVMPGTDRPAMGVDIDMGERPDVLLDERLSKISAQAQTEASGSTTLPEFLREQPAKTRWQRPAARISLSLLALLLLSALLLQAGHHFRDSLAVLHPELRPTLLAACAFSGCEIKPRQHIESIGVESNALNQVGSGNHYQLMVGLRNKADSDVATPWIDVSLTDSAGALVAKRVLGPLDFKTDKTVMPGGSELVLQAVLSTGNARVSGYSVEIFYP